MSKARKFTCVTDKYSRDYKQENYNLYKASPLNCCQSPVLRQIKEIPDICDRIKFKKAYYNLCKDKHLSFTCHLKDTKQRNNL